MSSPLFANNDKRLYLIAIAVLIVMICIVFVCEVYVYSYAVKHTGDNAVRVMVVMADNRPITSDPNNVLNLAVYLNYQYTRLHPGDDFRYVQFHNANTATTKNTPACYNALLKEPRAAPWCKLQAVYHILQNESDYQWIFFIDSDAIFTNYVVSITDFLNAVQTKTDGCSAQTFLVKSSSCSILFFIDAPYFDKQNTGQWIAKNNNLTRDYIRRWWGYSMPGRNFEHAYEQDAMYGMLANMAQRSETIGTILEPSMHHVSDMQLTHHMTSVSWPHEDRMRMINRTFARIVADPRFDQVDFAVVMKLIIERQMIVLDTSEDRIVE